MKTIHKTIGQVAKEAGITPFVIRAWEKRFGLTDPVRTETNRRLYSPEDVRMLCLLGTLTSAGYSIGQLVDQPLDALEGLVNDMAPMNESATSGIVGSAETQSEFVEHALNYVIAMDHNALQRLLHDANMKLTKPHLISGFLTPLLHEVGARWERGELRVAHEHMCAACIKSFLSNMLMNHAVPEGAQTLVACTSQGQEHEIGALAAALTAKVNGWNVCYLGPDLPSEEIAASAVQCKASAVLLSVSYPTPGVMEFQMLRQLLPDLPLIVGGRVVDRLRQSLAELNFRIVSSIDELPRELKSI